MPKKCKQYPMKPVTIFKHTNNHQLNRLLFSIEQHINPLKTHHLIEYAQGLFTEPSKLINFHYVTLTPLHKAIIQAKKLVNELEQKHHVICYEVGALQGSLNTYHDQCNTIDSLWREQFNHSEIRAKLSPEQKRYWHDYLDIPISEGESLATIKAISKARLSTVESKQHLDNIFAHQSIKNKSPFEQAYERTAQFLYRYGLQSWLIGQIAFYSIAMGFPVLLSPLPFYTLITTPSLIGLFASVKAVFRWGQDKVTTYQELKHYQAQQTFVHVEQFIRFRLEHYPAKINQYDFKGFLVEYNKIQIKIQQTRKNYRLNTILKKVIETKGVKINQVMADLEKTEQHIKKRCALIASKILKQIQLKFSLLEWDSTHQTLIPGVHKTQLKHALRFTHQFSSNKQLLEYQHLCMQSFAQHITPSSWCVEIDGVYQFDTRALKGWLTLVKHSQLAPEHKETVNRTLKTLIKKDPLSLALFEEFTRLIAHYAPRSTELLQQMLYSTLTSQHQSVVQLLDDHRKNELILWVRNHQRRIGTAIQRLEELVLRGNLPINQLLSAIEYCEKYQYAQEILPNELKQHAIPAFDSLPYSGAMPEYYLLMRLCPHLSVKEQRDFILKCATQRLDWIIEHKVAHGPDYELFNHPLLRESSFNIINRIESSPLFQSHSKGTARWLEALYDKGIIDKNLLPAYHQINKPQLTNKSVVCQQPSKVSSKLSFAA